MSAPRKRVLTPDSSFEAWRELWIAGSDKGSPRMNGLGLREEVHRLFERMYDALDRPVLNRDQLRDCTDQISTITMAHVTPGEDGLWNGYKLSGSERRIADYLYRRLGKVVQKEVLLDLLYGALNDTPEPKIIDVFICHIRKKLAQSAYSIESDYGGGYCMNYDPWHRLFRTSKPRKIAAHLYANLGRFVPTAELVEISGCSNLHSIKLQVNRRLKPAAKTIGFEITGKYPLGYKMAKLAA